MKLLILIALLTTGAFASETKTECPWMKEKNRRDNPKANLASIEAKSKNQIKTSNGITQ